MTNQQYVLGLDNGGSVTKAAIYSVSGNEIAVAEARVKPIMPKPGFVERDMAELWQANVKAIQNVIIQSGVNAKQIIGVAVTGHGNGAYFVDDKGEPVGNGIISTDTRAKEYVEKWNNDGVYENVLPKTMQILWAGQLMPIIAWFKDNNLAALQRAKWAFACKDYIRFCLTGEAYAELTDISVSSGLNLKTVDYDDALFKAYGIDEYKSVLPPLKKCTDICGMITEEVAKETGLKQGTLVAGGLCDVAACCIGTGITTQDSICVIAGTWSINEFISNKPIVSKDLFQTALYCMDDHWLILENSMTSASNLEWFVEHFMEAEKEKAEKENRSVFVHVNEMVNSVTTEDCPIIFLPFLYGTNINADARACFLGISGMHKKAHMLRAIYEGVVYSHMQHIENLLKFRAAPKSIKISGGAANSKVWVQIFADALQIQVEVSGVKELGTMGAAMCAAIASGSIKDFEEAVEVYSKIAYVCKPNSKKANIYQDKFNLYKKMVRSLDGKWSGWKKIL